MKTSENTLLFACNYFKEELKELYDSSEIEQSLFIMLSHYFKLNRIDLTLNSDNELSDSDFEKFTHVIKELKNNKPLAQIIGEWEFYDLNLTINQHILIPRPETEELVQLIINENNSKEPISILDIGTGSGCIALALKKHLPNTGLYAYDISDEALKIATTNAKKNNLDITFKKVDILDWENQGIKEDFDVIVSNPPYIPEKEKSVMNKNVLDYEPHLALFVKNEEPLQFYNAIADFGLNHLRENGKLYFEINKNYGREVQDMLVEKGYKKVNIVKDINEKDRIVRCNK